MVKNFTENKTQIIWPNVCLVFTLESEIIKMVVVEDTKIKIINSRRISTNKSIQFLKNKVSDEGCLYKPFPHSTQKVYFRKH